MKYKEFELFGVKRYERDEWIDTKFFGDIQRAIEFVNAYKSSTVYRYVIITADRFGNQIDVLWEV